MLFGLFKNNKKALAPADMSVLKTDMHSHLIPGIDDGSKSMDESVALIAKLKEAGFSRIITTPHIMSDFYKNNPDIILAGLDNLRLAVVSAGIDITIDAAAEYLVDDGFEKKLAQNNLMTFGDKYLLVELSYYNMYHGFFNVVFNLNIDGYKIILAHPERYGYFHDRFDVYEDLKARGLYFQLNTISLSGYYTPKVQKTAEKLIDMGLYDFAGSDMHNMDYMLNFRKALSSPYMHKLIESGKLMNHLL
jgi:protein-tyrosine phosphatase